MSFIEHKTDATAFPAGFFLAHEDCVRITVEADATNSAVKTTAEGGKYIPAGTIYPANDATAKGIIYEDVDVSTGNMPASLVVKGSVYTERLAVVPADTAKTALAEITFMTEPTVTRPF